MAGPDCWLTRPQAVLALAAHVVYNLYFHPLRKFPGPLAFRATRLAFIRRLLAGTLPFDVARIHEQYGPVVRIAPNELAFLSPEAWRDIYGHRTGTQHGADEFEKSSTFYRARGIPPNIISESRENHTLLRKQLAHGFSDRAMRDQEPIINSYVDLLIRRLRENYAAPPAAAAYTDSDEKQTAAPVKKLRALDLKSWYNWTTFDIIGDLAFGESFGCLENSDYHPWVGAIANTIHNGAYFQAAKLLKLDALLTPIFRTVFKGRRQNEQLTGDMLRRRLEAGEGRHDLIQGLISKRDAWHLDFARLRSNSSILVIAGSETTATLLTGVTYLLLANPAAMDRLKAEVRSAYACDEDITLSSVAGLSYMLACLNEALRRYPPVPTGMPRVTPRGGATVAGNAVPEGTVVACWQWATNHSAENWEKPFEFQPERFLDGSRNTNDKLDAMQPFSLGPRNCIGKKWVIPPPFLQACHCPLCCPLLTRESHTASPTLRCA